MTVNVLFGAGPSGYNANAALRRCADDGIGSCSDDVIRSVHKNLYVDYYIMSVADTGTAIEFVILI